MKKFYFFLALIMLSGATTFAQNVELSNNLIQRYETAKQKAVSKDATTHDHFWLTPILNEVAINWTELTDNAKTIFGQYRNRPTFTGDELIATLGNFAFHYTVNGTSGENVDPTDSNGNGIPDYVEDMAFTFQDDVNELYHTAAGYTVPPNDDTEVNGAYYDIYISGDVAGNGTYGYVQPETNVGDNPNSTNLTEVDAYTSFMVMRNNYTGFGDETVAMEVTCAHEYMHAVQGGYSVSMEAWFKEASATWGEDYVFPGHDDNLQYLSHIFGTPDVALNIGNGEAGGAYDGHWYGAWIFVKYMTEHTGNNIVKNIYERCITQYVVYAIDNELSENWSSSLDAMYIQYSIANVLMTSNSGFAPYTYSRASVYDNYVTNNGGYYVESTFDYSGTNLNFDSQSDGNNRLMRLSSDYFTMSSSQNFKITFTPDDPSAEIDILLFKISSTSWAIQTPEYVGSDAIINVTDNSNWTGYIPIVLRTDKAVSDTEPINYTINITNAAPTNIENTEKIEIAVYPNPANDYINIISPNTSLTNATVTDISGKEVLNKNLSKGHKIDTKELNNGIYFLTIYNDNQIIKTEKIIISH